MTTHTGELSFCIFAKRTNYHRCLFAQTGKEAIRRKRVAQTLSYANRLTNVLARSLHKSTSQYGEKPDLQNSNCTIRKHNEQAAQSRASISSALLDKRTPSIATKYCRLSPKVGFPPYFWISCIIMHRTDITSGLSRVLFYPKTKKHRWKAISHNLSHSFGLQFSIAYDRLQRPIQARLLASSKKRPNPDATADINQQSNQQ